jgi:glutamyl-tRNA reductase
VSQQHLLMIGVHQRSVPVAIRERFALQSPERTAQLMSFATDGAEGLCLSTCNRTEIYAVVAGSEPDPQPILQLLAEQTGIAQGELAEYVHILEGEHVTRHVCRLAAGLESMVLGEDQIVVQLKAAMEQAREQGTLGQTLNRLLQHALAAGKAVRTQTGIARSRLSVVSVALDLARQSIGQLSGRRILLIGAGQTAELALKHLRDEAPAAVTIANRTPARAADLAERYTARVIGLADLPAGLADADIVLSCTAANEPLIDAALVREIMAGRERPLLLLDLAVPRDIEREVASIPGVRLFDVDDLQKICDTNRAARAAEIDHADQIIDEAVAKFTEWWGARMATPTIRAIRERAEAIRSAEVQRTLARMPQLSEREQAAIQALSEAIINKLLHQPITTLKSNHDLEMLVAAQQLFQIEHV